MSISNLKLYNYYMKILPTKNDALILFILGSCGQRVELALSQYVRITLLYRHRKLPPRAAINPLIAEH